MGGNDDDKRSSRFLDAKVEGMPEREVLAAEPDDPGTVRSRDFACPVQRARIDEKDFEVSIGLPFDRRQHFGQPAFLVECPNDDTRFGRWDASLIGLASESGRGGRNRV